MKHKQNNKNKINAIIFTYHNEIIRIELNKNEAIQNKEDLDLLPIIRKSRKPPKRVSNNKDIIKEVQKSENSLQKDFNDILNEFSIIDTLFDGDNHEMNFLEYDF